MCENKNFNEAMAVFLKQFRPATSLSESDEELSTTEIQNLLTEMIDKASLDEIYNHMKQAGFDYQFIGGRIKWLLKKV